MSEYKLNNIKYSNNQTIARKKLFTLRIFRGKLFIRKANELILFRKGQLGLWKSGMKVQHNH